MRVLGVMFQMVGAGGVLIAKDENQYKLVVSFQNHTSQFIVN